MKRAHLRSRDVFRIRNTNVLFELLISSACRLSKKKKREKDGAARTDVPLPIRTNRATATTLRIT